MALKWEDYPPDIRPAIALAFEHSKRIPACSLCGKRRVSSGVAVPPILKSAIPTDMRPKAYALCKVHDALSADEVGDFLYGPVWREHDAP